MLQKRLGDKCDWSDGEKEENLGEGVQDIIKAWSCACTGPVKNFSFYLKMKWGFHGESSGRIWFTEVLVKSLLATVPEEMTARSGTSWKQDTGPSDASQTWGWAALGRNNDLVRSGGRLCYWAHSVILSAWELFLAIFCSACTGLCSNKSFLETFLDWPM